MILTTDNEYTAVLDACVLAPMPLCDTLLRCAEEPALFRPLWNRETLEEVHRVLQQFGYTLEQAENRLRRMREAFPEAEVCTPAKLLDGVPDIPDRDDRHVAAAAIHERAQVIVTFNLKDFPEELFAPHYISVQHPDAFLVDQFHLNRERVMDVLSCQASGIGVRRIELLEKLRVGLPTFSALARKQK